MELQSGQKKRGLVEFPNVLFKQLDSWMIELDFGEQKVFTGRCNDMDLEHSTGRVVVVCVSVFVSGVVCRFVVVHLSGRGD